MNLGFNFSFSYPSSGFLLSPMFHTMSTKKVSNDFLTPFKKMRNKKAFLNKILNLLIKREFRCMKIINHRLKCSDNDSSWQLKELKSLMIDLDFLQKKKCFENDREINKKQLLNTRMTFFSAPKTIKFRISKNIYLMLTCNKNFIFLLHSSIFSITF